MDTETFSCMETAGLLTEAQRSQLTKVSARLPQNEQDLLQVIAAATLSNVQNEQFYGSPIGSQSITSTGTGDIEQLTIPDGATKAIISVHTNNIIFRVDGENPAVTVGHTGVVGSNFSVSGLADFRFISAIAGNATIFVSYY